MQEKLRCREIDPVGQTKGKLTIDPPLPPSPRPRHTQILYLEDDQEQKVRVGHTQELLKEIQWEKRYDVVF